MEKTTIRDVARLSGCSTATVSRVLNGYAQVSEATRRKVENAVAELQYRHGEHDRRHIVVLVGTSGSSPRKDPENRLARDVYTWEMVSALSKVFYRAECRVEVLGMHDLGVVTPGRFSAAVALRYDERLSPDWCRRLELPLVAVNNPHPPQTGIYRVGSDERQGMEMAIGHLIGKGHERIGLLALGREDISQSRLDAYREAIERRGLLPFIQRVPLWADFFEPLGKLIHSGITALVVPGEEVGQQVAYALSLYRYRIPEEISLVGWETRRVSEYWLPRLTTLAQDFDRLAEKTLELLESAWSGGVASEEYIVPYLFHDRDSVAVHHPNTR